MSDFIKHECGVTLIRLLQPLEHYEKKYGTPAYGLNKLNLLMQKMRNRGQDGAGVACIKLNPSPGTKYIFRERIEGGQSIKRIFDKIYKPFDNYAKKKERNIDWLLKNKAFAGELLLGHLRYGTHGKNSKKNCHPFIRKNNWINRNLVVAGNFNLTNVDELFHHLVGLGQYPSDNTDTITVMEKIGHFLDVEIQRLYNYHKKDADARMDVAHIINEELDVARLLERSAKDFDGGYTMAGMIGHGDAFVMRDPNGIRPAFYYHDDEVVVVASERPAIQTAFNVHVSKVQELPRGHALIVRKNGQMNLEQFTPLRERMSCSFERIYFSRGTDRDIYLERKQLGEQLTERVLEAVDYDFPNTVFSFVPNTAESAFYGLMKGVDKKLNEIKQEEILELSQTQKLKPKKVEKILSKTYRVEKIVIKDEKLRTFITADNARGNMVSHGYDVTYGIVNNEKDTLVLLDDSIVRGTTLKNSIISIIARLKPKKVVIVSSAPQIRYPDCYGIDMSKMKDFVAFRALVELLKENGKEHLLKKTYKKCKAELKKPKAEMVNQVKDLYNEFSYEEVSKKIAQIVTPEGIKPKVEVIYQTVEGLRAACPDHNGDWYFSGNYPTPGGNKVANIAFINYFENKNERAY